MPRSFTTLTLDDAKRMLAAAEDQARSFGIAYDIAVVDAGGAPHPAASGTAAGGIRHCNGGRVVVFGGGVPVLVDGAVVGAVGASAGSVEQDVAVAQAAVAALGGVAGRKK